MDLERSVQSVFLVCAGLAVYLFCSWFAYLLSAVILKALCPYVSVSPARMFAICQIIGCAALLAILLFALNEYEKTKN